MADDVVEKIRHKSSSTTYSRGFLTSLFHYSYNNPNNLFRVFQAYCNPINKNSTRLSLFINKSNTENFEILKYKLAKLNAERAAIHS